MKAKEYTIDFWRFYGGITLYPYQFSLGLSIRYWPCISTPAFRLYIGPLKFWICLLNKKEIKMSNVEDIYHFLILRNCQGLTYLKDEKYSVRVRVHLPNISVLDEKLGFILHSNCNGSFRVAICLDTLQQLFMVIDMDPDEIEPC